MITYPVRKKLIDIARRDVGKVETSKNRGEWIRKFWPCTSYPNGYTERQPYCAAALCYVLAMWLEEKDVLAALWMDQDHAMKWRCRSAAAFDWEKWARKNKLQVLPQNCILHMGDIVIYTYSHIELVSGDDNTDDGPFMAVGFNTNSGGDRDGDGCWEKARSRGSVKCFIRILP